MQAISEVFEIVFTLNTFKVPHYFAFLLPCFFCLCSVFKVQFVPPAAANYEFQMLNFELSSL
jgi:hypothetical protein